MWRTVVSRLVAVPVAANSMSLRIALVFAMWLWLAPPAPAAQPEPASCRSVRLPMSVGPTITATTALSSRNPRRIGLSGRHADSLDSGHVRRSRIADRRPIWRLQPSMEVDRKPFLPTIGQVVRCKFERRQVHAGGSRLCRTGGVRNSMTWVISERFDHKIYGIEPGNNGNRIIAGMIADNRFGLGSWTLVESASRGCLSEVDRALRRSKWIVFLGWSPHPMNLKYQMEYLTGATIPSGQISAGRRLHRRAHRVLGGVPQRGQVSSEPSIHARTREPDDGADLEVIARAARPRHSS